MNNAELPAISNWIGLLLLPGLAWFLNGRLLRRVLNPPSGVTAKKVVSSLLRGFVLSLLFGAALAISFVQGYEAVNSYLFIALFPIALVVPVYRSEYILGFILGLTFTFGAVLPTGIALVFASISAAVRLCIRFLFRLLKRR